MESDFYKEVLLLFSCVSLAFTFLPTCLSADSSENVEALPVLDTPSVASLYSLIEGLYYLVDENQPEGAVPYFRRAIELDSNHGDAYYFLGVSYYRQREDSSPDLDKPPKDSGVDHQFIAHALFYLHEAEKREVVHDQFRPELLKEIQRQYPDIRPSPWGSDKSIPQDERKSKGAQIIVEGKVGREGTITLQSSDGIVQEFKLGEPIALPEGERYTLQFKRKQIHHLLKPLVLVSSVLGVLLLR